MKNRLKDFAAAMTITITNSSGSTMAGGKPVDIAGLMWGIPTADIADTKDGAVELGGEFEFTKATGIVLTRGQVVGYDKANERIQVDTNGRPGIQITEAAGTNDITCIGRLNVEPRTKTLKVLGDASGGLAVNTGLAVVPRAVIVQSTTTAGALRTLSNVVKGTGGSAGIITITTSAGAGTDEHVIYAVYD